MKTKKYISITVLILAAAALTACANSSQISNDDLSAPTQTAAIETLSTLEKNNPLGFLSTSGQAILNSESLEPVILRGVNFPKEMEISFADYESVNELNANMVRLALDFNEFSSNPDWDWLDQQIEWSKQNEVYITLVLDFQSSYAVWGSSSLQEDVIAFWASIASRYSHDSTIAAYDLFNSPAPDNLDQWQSLAERIATSIRDANDQHILIVQGTRNPERSFIYIDDPNIILGFLFFKPSNFTELNQGQYPVTELFMPDWSDFVGSQGINSFNVPLGTTNWHETQSPLTLIVDRKKLIGIPSLNCQNSLGDVYFSNFVVEEYDEDGRFLGNIVDIDFSEDRFWGPWSYQDSATIELVNDELFGSVVKFSPTHEGQPATGTVADLNYAFEITTERSYSIYGWIRGEKVQDGTDCKFLVEVNNFIGNDPLLVWDKEHLKYELSRLANYGAHHDYPMMLVDFGTRRTTSFKGGEKWLEDMLAILDELGINYAYNSLRDDQWGLFKMDGTSDLSLDKVLSTHIGNKPEMSLPQTQDISEVDVGVGTDLGFIRARGQELVVGSKDEIIYLQGINFSNFNYTGDFQDIPHHTKRDFFSVRDMGMNVIRFGLSYEFFEKDDMPYQYNQEAWVWLDKQIAWAKEAGVYVILNMHIVPGQMNDNMMGLTTNLEHQKRTAALWKAIAERYRDETTIAGYDLINEPSFITETEYQSYAQLLIDTIRDVDPNHLIIVEAINFEPPLFVLVDDENVMYDFHFYRPYDFTHENGSDQISSGTYPDEDYLELNFETLRALEITRTPALSSGSSDWALFESPIEEPGSQGNGTVIGYGKINCNRNAGTAYFGDVQIVEIDPESDTELIVRDIVINHNLQIWTNSSSASDVFGMSPLNPHNTLSGRALTIAGVNNWASIEFARQSFDAMPGASYQIKGWMRGDDITVGSDCHLLIEWFQLPENETLVHHNQAYLQDLIMSGVTFGQEQGVPVNVGEFGVIETTQYPHKGGLVWLDDMLTLLIENNLNFTYWEYHGSWGIYHDMERYPDAADAQPGMIEVFEKHLK
jgi:endoglucanase